MVGWLDVIDSLRAWRSDSRLLLVTATRPDTIVVLEIDLHLNVHVQFYWPDPHAPIMGCHMLSSLMIISMEKFGKNSSIWSFVIKTQVHWRRGSSRFRWQWWLLLLFGIIIFIVIIELSLLILYIIYICLLNRMCLHFIVCSVGWWQLWWYLFVHICPLQ